MELLWPRFLLLLWLIPILIIAYILVLRRRKKYAVRYSSLSLVREALQKQSQWKRHLPFALFLLALSSLMLALTRPVTTATLPAPNATIILLPSSVNAVWVTDSTTGDDQPSSFLTFCMPSHDAVSHRQVWQICRFTQPAQKLVGRAYARPTCKSSLSHWRS